MDQGNRNIALIMKDLKSNSGEDHGNTLKDMYKNNYIDSISDMNMMKEVIIPSDDSHRFDVHNLTQNSAVHTSICTVKEKEFSIINNTMTSPEKIINEIRDTCILRCFICSKKENLRSSNIEVMCNKCKFLLKYECLKCHKLFSSSDHFYIHKKHCYDFVINESKQRNENFQKEILMLQCKTCAFVTTQNHKLLEHIKKKHIFLNEQQANRNKIMGIENNISSNKDDFLNNSEVTRFSVIIGETKLESTQRSYIMSCPSCDQPSDVVSTRKAVICDKCKIRKNYRCLICDKRCSSYQNINYHVRACADNKFYYCSSCKYKSVHKHNLLKHVLKLHISKQSNDQTAVCTDTKSSIIENQTAYSMNYSYLQCRFCPVKVKFEDELRLHLNNEHPECIKTSAIQNVTENVIEGHKYIDTKKLRLLYCPECDVSFKDETELSIKCIKCNSDLFLQCLICNSIFKSYASINSHLMSKCASSDYLQCSECDLILSWHSEDLEKFLTKHNFVNISTSKECAQCGLTFVHQDDMINHVLYQCPSKKAPKDVCNARNTKSHINISSEKRDWNTANISTVLNDDIKKVKMNNNVNENVQEITVMENNMNLQNGEIVMPDGVQIDENSVILLYLS